MSRFTSKNKMEIINKRGKGEELDILELLKQMKRIDALGLAEQCNNYGIAHPKNQRSLTDKQRYLKQLKGGFRK